ncbi:MULTISPECIES: TadE/TadG family type IV pilus assembly protein [unclassified Hyphomonas]|jgi:Flp pilus assembly protein TadG|uniref:TadE/TadG family type IV pilus assembly protein n=1 Tax=unclassified Hyphomonas TaxID=2630699 RepID=UPI000458C753|nr:MULTISPECIES: TadE family protein [unclassified Hyphomonas]KCZ46571.1 hypothetical protein HY17_07455 [Hyphomonas sp. CY54-11-8]RAN39153.1 hypothetical protein HY26_16870 [Hyphomonas sp. GM-8P]
MSKLTKLNLVRLQWSRSIRGIAAVEFALTAPLFVLLLLGIITYGISIKEHGDAQEAIRAGAHAAMSDVRDTSAIQNVVYQALNSTKYRSRVNVKRSLRCDGADTTSVNCSDGRAAEEFVEINLRVFSNAELTGTPKIQKDVEVRVF